ncbi:butyrophilin subfamily 1 member A1-like [Chanos chanos]|uniref:Butyrophilin subfamily 1 member A1-like n=1 Tax=Chanos chanos TaxID=29144 RepID=A0A6J2VTT8_CHACN|nr:butyrophilin subfamily 1 member A1-like [Chanos chanos]
MEGYSIGKGVSLLCESNNWWPEPEVVWLDNDGNLPAEDTETLGDPERFHVKKRVTAQDGNTNRFYCRAMLRDHMKEAVIVIWKDVTLDPDTAHPNLFLSDGGKQVMHGNKQQDLPDNSKRITNRFSVLGKEGFSSGRFYNEVQVSGKTEWDIGVVKESVNRERFITLSPKSGFWTVCLKNDQFQVVGPDGPLVVGAGEDLILPCSLKPNISAVDMTVEWFKLHTSDLLLHLYEGGAESKNQIQSYRGRTSLFKEELQKGNASLKLSRVKTTDEGEYKCVVRSENWIDDIAFSVSVAAVGTYPVISMEGYSTDGGLHLLCEIKGWNPEPEVLWLNSDGKLLPAEDTETLRDTESFHVKKRVTVQDSDTNRFYCRVILRDHMKETGIVISSQVFHTWRRHIIWISVLVLFIEKQKQIDEVDVTLNPDTAHPKLILSDDGKKVRDGETQQKLPDNPERFNYWLSVLGKEEFTTGRFYYEVQVSGKTDWTLGVATKSVNRKEFSTWSPENGYWTISLWNRNEYKALADTPVLLSLKQKLQRVGVFVDYEEGLVSFYDVEARSHIYSFTDQIFTEILCPYFCPWPNDGGRNSTPLIITPVNHTE